MNKNTLRLTTGAMLTAVFGLLMLLNRQSGGMLEGAFQYLIPIPMAAYTALYGPSHSLPVFAAMTFLAVFLGNVSTLFFEVAHVVIGFVFGICLYKKIDTTKILFIVMAMTAVVNMLDLYVAATVSGISLDRDITEMQNMIQKTAETVGMAFPEAMLNEGYLRRIFLMGIAFGGAMQGFIIYQVSLLLLRRLRFQIQKPRRLLTYHPPKWTGLLAGAAFLLMTFVTGLSLDASGNIRPEYELAFGICQIIGMAGSMFLMVFGVIALQGIMNYYRIENKLVRILALVFFFFTLSQILVFLGFLYVMQFTDLIRAVIAENSEETPGK